MVAEKIERGALILMFYALSLCYNVNWELLVVPNEAWILQCLHSQATITQDTEDDYNYCTYDSDISTGFGVGAFLLFMASQVIIMVASQCFCCGKAVSRNFVPQSGCILPEVEVLLSKDISRKSVYMKMYSEVEVLIFFLKKGVCELRLPNYK